MGEGELVGFLQGRIAGLEAELELERARAAAWRAAVEAERCPGCRHPRGPLKSAESLERDGNVCVWACPCDCHADGAALKAEAERLRGEVRRLGTEVTRLRIDLAAARAG